MEIEKIKEELRFVKEERNLPGEDLARMIEILKDKVNEIIDALNLASKGVR